MFETLYAVLDRSVATIHGAQQFHYACMRGRRVLHAGVCTADELAGLKTQTLRVALVSPLNYSRRVSLEVFRRSLVPFIARRQLDQDALFSDRFRLRTELLSLREGRAEVCVVACLESDVEILMERLPVHSRPLTHLALAESAVAALVGRATPDPVLVLWYRQGVLTCLGVANSRVLWQRSQRVDVENFMNADHWRTVVERAVAMAPTEFSLALRLNLGEGPWRQCNAWAVNGSQTIVATLSKLFHGVPAESVLATPELYGMAYVPRRVNLLINGYAKKVKAWQWGVPVAALTACAGLLLIYLGLVTSHSADRLRAAALLEAPPLVARHAQVLTTLPSEVAVQELKKVLELNDILTSSMRVDYLLARLTTIVPPDVRLKRLEISQVKKDKTSPVQQATDAKPMGKNEFYMSLELVLKGGYAESLTQTKLLVERLAELGRLEGTRFIHAIDQTRGAGDAPIGVFSTRVLLNKTDMP